MYHTTETARLADLVLPAAAWGEKEGTFINSERRIGLIKKVRRAPGQALSDFHIFKLVAHYYGCDAMFARWESPEAVFQILKALTAGMPCDITGIADYRMLDEAGGIQWPFPAEGADAARQRRLFADGRFYLPGRPRPLPLRLAAGPPRAAGPRLPLPAPDGPGQRRAVAHPDADGEIRHPPQALSPGPVRRDPPRRRRGARPARRPVGGGRVAPGTGARAGRAHGDRPAGMPLPAHARRIHQPADRRRIRSGVATAGLQVLRGTGPGDRARRDRRRGHRSAT